MRRTSVTDLTVVPLVTHKQAADEQVTRALEEMLADAKAGKINRLVVVGIDDGNGFTHRVRHRANCPEMIGAVSLVLHQMQSEWNGRAASEERSY